MPPTAHEPPIDLAVIGGGAAGLTAAIFAGEASADRARRIVVIDSAKALGAKILVAGGGRCNVTHDVVTPADFNGSRNVVRNILAAFDVQATVRWFDSMGVKLKREETGKLFPVTDSARTVVDALLERCHDLNIEILTAAKVQRIGRPTSEQPCFMIHHDRGSTPAQRIVLSTGGRSLPRSGSDGSGWELVKALGHTVTPTHAALAPLTLDARMFHAELSGLSLDVELSTYAQGKRIDHRSGSLLWTHFGISGPVVMDASRHWIIAKETGGGPEMFCNLLPGESFESVEQWLIELSRSRPKLMVMNALSDRLAQRISACLMARENIEPTTTCGQLPRDARRALTHAVTKLPLPIQNHRGWNYAEVTAGGVPLQEIDFRTMESRKTPSLFLAGEILDCDGRIGGFNFQWAWATGYLAGKNAMR